MAAALGEEPLDGNDICPVCLEDLTPEQKRGESADAGKNAAVCCGCSKPTGHGDCINEAIVKHKNECPECRFRNPHYIARVNRTTFLKNSTEGVIDVTSKDGRTLTGELEQLAGRVEGMSQAQFAQEFPTDYEKETNELDDYNVYDMAVLKALTDEWKGSAGECVQALVSRHAVPRTKIRRTVTFPGGQTVEAAITDEIGARFLKMFGEKRKERFQGLLEGSKERMANAFVAYLDQKVPSLDSYCVMANPDDAATDPVIRSVVHRLYKIFYKQEWMGTVTTTLHSTHVAYADDDECLDDCFSLDFIGEEDWVRAATCYDRIARMRYQNR